MDETTGLPRPTDSRPGAPAGGAVSPTGSALALGPNRSTPPLADSPEHEASRGACVDPQAPTVHRPCVRGNGIPFWWGVMSGGRVGQASSMAYVRRQTARGRGYLSSIWAPAFASSKSIQGRRQSSH